MTSYGNVNLQGTSFAVSQLFAVGGTSSRIGRINGVSDQNSINVINQQVLHMGTGGTCGYLEPSPFGSNVMQLVLAGATYGAGAAPQQATVTVTVEPPPAIVVNTTSDDFGGVTCSLRNAIQTLNSGASFGGCSYTPSGAI